MDLFSYVFHVFLILNYSNFDIEMFALRSSTLVSIGREVGKKNQN